MVRNEDLLWFEDGNGNREFLHPMAIEEFCIEELKDYQFCGLGKDTFKMIVEISETASEDSQADAKGVPGSTGIFFVSSRQEGEADFMDAGPFPGFKVVAIKDEDRDSE